MDHVRQNRLSKRRGWLAGSGLGGAGVVFAFGIAAFGKDAVAPSSTAPWSPPRLDRYEAELAPEASREELIWGKVRIDPEKVYDLPELIDIAQRNNPETRVAWERAREAAAAVGLSASTYYPYLAASAGAGAERTIIPVPTVDPATMRVVGGTVPIRDHKVDAALSVKWLLIDFGQRGAIVDAAKQQLVMANVGFNATHQKIVFEVTRDFYELGNARQQVTVATSALRAAQTVEQAVKARLDNGLAIKPEYLQAQQQTAQFGYETRGGVGRGERRASGPDRQSRHPADDATPDSGLWEQAASGGAGGVSGPIDRFGPVPTPGPGHQTGEPPGETSRSARGPRGLSPEGLSLRGGRASRVPGERE